ncbi:MAG: hypothetical protein ACI9C4_002388, partial [Paraglaciecola sp.]
GRLFSSSKAIFGAVRQASVSICLGAQTSVNLWVKNLGY